MLKNNRGITLIALIIILVVLTILSVVTINVTQGNKVIDKTEDILYDYEDLQVAEKIKLEYMKQKELGNIETVKDKNKLLEQITGNDWCKFASLSEDGNYISIESKKGRRYKLYINSGNVSTNKDESEIIIDTSKSSITIKAKPENSYINIESMNTGRTAYGTGEVTLEDYKGSHITYTVSCEGYQSQTNTMVLGQNDSTINVNLEILKYTVKIFVEDSEAIVTIYDSSGNELQIGKGSQEITVSYGDTISYTVSKEGYNDINGRVENITENKQVSNIRLEKKKYTVKLNVLDINGEILTGVIRKVNGTTITDSGILIEHGTQIAYSAEKEGYNTKQGVEMITSDKEITITLKKPCTIIINATPSDATIKINGTTRNSITLEEGDKLSYSVEKSGYESVTKENITVTKGETINITLKKIWVVTIKPTPSDATVKINGKTTKQLTVYDGDTISYSVEKTGYAPQSGSKTINETTTMSITLKIYTYAVTINPTPSDATVTIKKSDGTQLASGTGTQSATVDYGTNITYTVSKSLYTSKSGNINSISSNQTLNISLDRTYLAFTTNKIYFTSNSNSTYSGILNGGSATASYKGSGSKTVDMGTFTIDANTIANALPSGDTSIDSNGGIRISKVTLHFKFQASGGGAYSNNILTTIYTGSTTKMNQATHKRDGSNTVNVSYALTNITRNDLKNGYKVHLKDEIKSAYIQASGKVSSMYITIEGTKPET